MLKSGFGTIDIPAEEAHDYHHKRGHKIIDRLFDIQRNNHHDIYSKI